MSRALADAGTRDTHVFWSVAEKSSACTDLASALRPLISVPQTRPLLTRQVIFPVPSKTQSTEASGRPSPLPPQNRLRQGLAVLRLFPLS